MEFIIIKRLENLAKAKKNLRYDETKIKLFQNEGCLDV